MSKPLRAISAVVLFAALALFALLVASVLPAAGQEVVDSVTIDILSPPAAITITAPERAYRGDTITVAYQIVDEVGNPTEGVATWAVSPANRATVLSQTDSTVAIRLDSPGRVTLIVTVDRLDRLVIGGRYNEPGLMEDGTEIPAGTFDWGGPFHLRVGGTASMCAVGFAGERAVFVSDLLCYENLGSLIGDVPPLSQMYWPGQWQMPMLRMAYHRARVSGVLPPVYLNPGIMG
jgi:hypothetical protein